MNIFGLPMSGKDTVGVKFAEAIGGKFLSSGLVIRAMEVQTQRHYTDKGEMTPTDVFYDWVLPYFEREDLKQFPLVLSSIGRWGGEEDVVMDRARKSGHPIKLAVILNVSEMEVMERWKKVKTLGDRGGRSDDEKPEVFQTRLKEFREKTMPVLLHYRAMGILLDVNGHAERETVFDNLVDKVFEFAVNHA